MQRDKNDMLKKILNYISFRS